MQEKLLHLYDAETGQETDESLLGVQMAAEIREMEEGDAYEAMTKTRGWKILEEELLRGIDAATNSLIDSDDIEEIKKHQSMVRAYSNVLGLVRHKVARAAEIRNDKKDPQG